MLCHWVGSVRYNSGVFGWGGNPTFFLIKTGDKKKLISGWTRLYKPIQESIHRFSLRLLCRIMDMASRVRRSLTVQQAIATPPADILLA